MNSCRNSLDVLAENYGSGLGTLDFAGAPEEARARINGLGL